MPWARIEDDYLENPKLVGLSTAAICLDLCAIVFCSRSLRDGYLSVRDVEVVAKLIHLRRWKAVASELVGARRWVELDGGGWVIHDYLKYQPSREHVLSERAAAAERMRRAREKFDGSSPERSPEVRKKFALPVPGPGPGPERSTNVLATPLPPSVATEGGAPSPGANDEETNDGSTNVLNGACCPFAAITNGEQHSEFCTR